MFRERDVARLLCLILFVIECSAVDIHRHTIVSIENMTTSVSEINAIANGIRLHEITFLSQYTDNSGCFPRGKRSAIVRRYPALLTPVCSVFVFPYHQLFTLLRQMHMGAFINMRLLSASFGKLYWYRIFVRSQV